MILGLSFGIDSAAALVAGSRIDSAAAEERFDRRKHSRAFPSSAARFCLAHGGVAVDALEHVGFFWNPAEQARAFDPRRASYRDHREYFELVPSHLFQTLGGVGPVEESEQLFRIRGRQAPLRVHYFPHHLCHAAAAFYPSGFDRAAFLVADGYGERTSLSMGRGEGTALLPLAEVAYPHSLGSVYAAVTEHLGFRPNSDEGTVMALAALGTPSSAFDSILTLEPEGRFSVDTSYFNYHPYSLSRCSGRFADRFGPARTPGEPLGDRHRELAATVQRRLEEVLLHAARWLRDATGLRELVMAGGVALNSVAVSRVLAEAGFERLFVCPAASDAGAALGAALMVAHRVLGRPRDPAPYTDFLGPDVSAGAREALEAGGLAFRELPDPALEAAQRVARGEVVGWVQGRMELGPRALGSRSILADPRSRDTKERLNRLVKHREPYRPFAPAVVEERAGEFFEGPFPSPFMSRVHRALPLAMARLPSVLHADGTARVQTVAREQDPRFHALLTALGELTGLPVVLNTSFNDRGEPIVATTADAVRCFYSTGIDALIVDRFLLEKSR